MNPHDTSIYVKCAILIALKHNHKCNGLGEGNDESRGLQTPAGWTIQLNSCLFTCQLNSPKSNDDDN